MNLAILNKEIQQFITDNLKSNLSKLILKGSPFKDISIQELAQQIVGKQKAKKKLPTWFACQNVYYPPKINLEQTSSEITANYKASLLSGDSIIDITGGFGVDCYAFSQKFQEVTHYELNSELSEIVKHNFKQLKIDNTDFITGDGIDFLKHTPKKFDCVYIDPSRRSDAKGKVFLLEDCLPNVPENLDFLFSKANQVLIKNSPLLDISNTIKELEFVKEIHVIAVHNEVKELLFLLEKEYKSTIAIKTVNHQKSQVQKFEFEYQKAIIPHYSNPLQYIYEPNAAILKSGGFHQISVQFSLYKLQQHSHVYTSNELLPDFPGRKFRLQQAIPYNKKELQRLLKNKKANITTRNFPKTVAQIRKETKIKEGGEIYLFFTTNLENKAIVLFCEQVFG